MGHLQLVKPGRGARESQDNEPGRTRRLEHQCQVEPGFTKHASQEEPGKRLMK